MTARVVFNCSARATMVSAAVPNRVARMPTAVRRPAAPLLRAQPCSAPRLAPARAAPLESQSTPDEVASNVGPFSTLHHVAEAAWHFIVDAWKMLQRLVELVQRVRVAAASIQASTESRAAAASLEAAPAAGASPATPAPLQAQLFGAVSHLRATLTDATGTLEAKWRALEGTAGERMDGLFAATKDSAAALQRLQASSGDGAERLWGKENAAAVVLEEEALRQQVFAQVFAELNAQARRDGGSAPGYSPA